MKGLVSNSAKLSAAFKLSATSKAHHKSTVSVGYQPVCQPRCPPVVHVAWSEGQQVRNAYMSLVIQCVHATSYNPRNILLTQGLRERFRYEHESPNSPFILFAKMCDPPPRSTQTHLLATTNQPPIVMVYLSPSDNSSSSNHFRLSCLHPQIPVVVHLHSLSPRYRHWTNHVLTEYPARLPLLQFQQHSIHVKILPQKNLCSCELTGGWVFLIRLFLW